MINILHVVGVSFLLLSLIRGNVERSLWLGMSTVDTMRALKIVRANGRAIGVRTRRKLLREALVCWISFVVAQPISWLANGLLGWLPFYRSLKTLTVLLCVYWRFETSALFYQAVIIPVLRRHEKRIDLTLSLLHVTMGVVYHLVVELPQSVAKTLLHPVWRSSINYGHATPSTSTQPLSASSGHADEKLYDAKATTSIPSFPRRNSLNKKSEVPPRRVSPSAKVSRLPVWPPPKRSVFSEEVAVKRKPSASLTKARAARATTSQTNVASNARPGSGDAGLKRRTASGASQTKLGTHQRRKESNTKESPTTEAVASTAEKLLSLPAPPAKDPEDSSSSPPSTSRTQPAQAPASKVDNKDEESDDHPRSSPKKRQREERDDTLLPPKRRMSRKAATTTSAADNKGATGSTSLRRKSGTATASAPTRRAARAPQVTTASAEHSASTVSTTIGKRTRGREKESKASPPKRTRSSRSTGKNHAPD